MRTSLRPEPLEPDFEAEVLRLRAEIVAEDEAEAKAAFHLRLRERGIQDRAVLRALEVVPRQTFVSDRFLDLAVRDLALPIDCGQTIDATWLIGRMIDALAVEPGHRVLQIGAGTGYATAILAHLAAEVVAIERYQSLANAARNRLAAFESAHAAPAYINIVWGDGLALSSDAGRFDRILVHGLLPELPVTLTSRLRPNGALVAARPTGDGQAVTRIIWTSDGLVETPICPCRLQPIVPGLAGTL